MKIEIYEVEGNNYSVVLKVDNQLPNLTPEQEAKIRRILGKAIDKLRWILPKQYV